MFCILVSGFGILLSILTIFLFSKFTLGFIEFSTAFDSNLILLSSLNFELYLLSCCAYNSVNFFFSVFNLSPICFNKPFLIFFNSSSYVFLYCSFKFSICNFNSASFWLFFCFKSDISFSSFFITISFCFNLLLNSFIFIFDFDMSTSFCWICFK